MDATQFDGSAVRETYGFTGFSTAGPTTLGVPPDFEVPHAFAGAPSHPRQSRFFRTAAVDPENSCPDCTRFLVDYNGVAVDRLGRIHVIWTDMRRQVATREQLPRRRALRPSRSRSSRRMHTTRNDR